jgi:sec-independent protein translocase protein TatA
MGLENPVHILILLVVVLLVFGAKRLPEMGRSLGDGMRGFKDSLNGHTAQDALPRPYEAAASMTAVQATAPAPAPVVAFGHTAIDSDEQARRAA